MVKLLAALCQAALIQGYALPWERRSPRNKREADFILGDYQLVETDGCTDNDSWEFSPGWCSNNDVWREFKRVDIDLSSRTSLNFAVETVCCFTIYFLTNESPNYPQSWHQGFSDENTAYYSTNMNLFELTMGSRSNTEVILRNPEPGTGYVMGQVQTKTVPHSLSNNQAVYFDVDWSGDDFVVRYSYHPYWGFMNLVTATNYRTRINLDSGNFFNSIAVASGGPARANWYFPARFFADYEYEEDSFYADDGNGICQDDDIDCNGQGTCYNVEDESEGTDYTCMCNNFYEGNECDTAPSCTTSNTCVNGICIQDDHESHHCVCDAGYKGDACDEEVSTGDGTYREIVTTIANSGEYEASDPIYHPESGIDLTGRTEFNFRVKSPNGYLYIHYITNYGNRLELIMGPGSGTRSLWRAIPGSEYGWFCNSNILDEATSDFIDLQLYWGNPGQFGVRKLVNGEYTLICLSNFMKSHVGLKSDDTFVKSLSFATGDPNNNGHGANVLQIPSEYFEDFNVPETNQCDSSPCVNGGVCSGDADSYTCACTQSFSGTNCQDAAEVSITSAADLLDKVVNGPFSRKKRALDLNALSTHGCFCARLDGSSLSGPSGKPVSPYDQICRNNQWCASCKSEGTSCQKGDGYPYSVALNSQFEYECVDSANNACQQNQCECDLNTANRLKQYEADTGLAVDGGASCNGVQASGNSGSKQWTCCGKNANWLIYNDNSRLECDDSQDEPRIYNLISGNTVTEYL